MGIERQFYLKEDKDGLGYDSNIVERLAGSADTILRVFPVDNYEFPEEIKRQAREWHVLKVPLLGQQLLKPEQEPDWCGRTSASMLYNYFQLIKGGDPRSRYITHSRAGDPECHLDLRYPTGERAFFGPPYDSSQPKNGWGSAVRGLYEIQSNYSDYHASDEGEVPVPLGKLFPYPEKRPKGVGGVLRYHSPSEYVESIGHLLPTALRQEADAIHQDEKRAHERFAHLIDCLRANNPVLIYTGIGFRNQKDNVDPRHIIVICGYCILELGGVRQLWLVTADPSSKFGFAKTMLPAPNPEGRVDLGHRLEPHHALFRMRSGLLNDSFKMKGFASFNLVRATAFFGKNPEAVKTGFNRFLDHSDTHCGRYAWRDKRTDAPPEVVDSSFSRPKYSFPLRGNTASSHPWQCYYNNESLETGIGGYYVLGLQRNLHGGVHLFPPSHQEFAPVSAVAPGYVVAARLPGRHSASLLPGVAEALGNWPGFVLLRHEVEALSNDKATGEKGALYTLYMHLRSPTYPAATASEQIRSSELDRYFRQVPWFQKLYRQRFGAWVSIAAEDVDAPPGTLRWSAGPVTDEDPKLQEAGATAGGREAKVLAEDGSTKSITVRTTEGQVQWLYKAPPGNLQAAMTTLADGKVVTFDEPFFPVKTGEVLGFAGPLPGERATSPLHFQVPADPEVPGRRKQFSLRSGFLHFQLFCPQDEKENGINLLAELMQKLEVDGASVSGFVEVKEDQEDNFLEVSEVEKHLKDALPAEDRGPFGKATAEVFEAAGTIQRSSMNYGPVVASLLDKTTSFALEAEKPDWSSPCCRFAYPLTLEVEPLYLPKPEQNSMVTGGSYELELCFEQEVAGDWLRMECPRGGCGGSDEKGRKVCKPSVLKLDANKLASAKDGIVPLSLKVPAMAERMTLKAKGGFFIEQSISLPGADIRLFKQGITRRWRNVRLVQKNEWTSDNVQTVLKKVNAALGIDTEEAAKKTVAEIAWCDAAKEAHIARISPLSDTPPPEPGAKLFKGGGWLSPSGRLENLHPVTGVWLLNVLDKQKKARVREEWAVPSFRHEDPRPLCAGWVVKGDTRRVGDTVTAVVIDEDFGYDPRNRVTLLARRGSYELVLAGGREFGPGGNIVQEVQTSFWGEWSLVVADTSTPPQALDPKAQPPFLTQKVTVPRPKLVGEQAVGEPVVIERPTRQADGSWHWRFQFEGQAPSELAGSVLLRTDTRETGPGILHPERVLPITARSLTNAKVPAIDATLFVFGESDRKDFIVDLTADGQRIFEGKDKLYIFEGQVRFLDCFKAMDIRVSWSLVKGLQKLATKKVIFKLKDLSADGLTCWVDSAADLSRFDVAGAKRAELNPDGLVELEFAPAVCDDPKVSSAWVFDEQRQTILNSSIVARDKPLGALKYSVYQAVYREGQRVNLHKGLAAALWHVEKALGKNVALVIERIEGSGMSCVIDASGKGAVDKVHVAAASGGFEVTEADPARKSRLRLTVNPSSANWMVTTFHPGRIFDSLNRSGLEPGADLFYWFEFVALNGQPLLYCHPGENTGESDGSLTLAEFEALKAKTSEPIRATHAEPGRYRKVALHETLSFKPAPKTGSCELEISASARGAPEDLNRYMATFFRKAPKGTKWEPLKGFTKLRPEKLEIQGENIAADWLLAARVPYPQTPVDGATEFKVELSAAEGMDCEPRQLEVTGSYDFKPRWEGELKVEPQGDVLELRCHGEGLEVPVPGSRTQSAWNVAREFELVVTPDEADPHLEGIKPKLSDHIRYATPSGREKRGGCDLQGDFVATLDLKALKPDVSYTFTLRRVNNLPVRQTVIPEKSQTFTRPQAAQPPGSEAAPRADSQPEE